MTDAGHSPLVGALLTPGLQERPPVPHVRRAIAQNADGRTIAYAETAVRGPDVVLIHGTLMTLEDMWLGPMTALAPHYRIVAVDRPGHGQSMRRRLVDASPWRQAEIIHDAIRAIGLRRPVIVGHSAGGAVALAYGMQFPEDVTGVVALAPICFPEPRLEQALFGPRGMPLGNAIAAAAAGGVDPLLLPALWRAMFLPQEMPAKFMAGFPFALASQPAQMIAEGEDSLALGPALVRSALAYATCQAPVEILGGSADVVVNSWTNGYRAAQMIPTARFRMHPGTGHMLHHFHADEVLAAVERVRTRSLL